jgi:hypothetical protein
MFGKPTHRSIQSARNSTSRKGIAPRPACIERLEDRVFLSVTTPTGQHVDTPDRTQTNAPKTISPVLAAVPDGTVNQGSTFVYQLAATGTPTPTYGLSSGPSGMVVNSATGLLTWTPTTKQLGTQTIRVKATNSAGSSSQTFHITVTNYVAPVVTTPSGLTATAGAAFSYQMVATAGNPAPVFSLATAPAGMTITPTGLISWNPTSSQMGAQAVSVLASNIQGSVNSSFSVSVVPDTVAPVAPYLTIGPVTAVDSLPLSWSGATDNVGVVAYNIYTYTPAVYRGHSGRGGGITLVSPAKYTLLVGGVTGTSYTITGLTPNTTYQYAVTALDAAGNQSGYSNVASGTTLLAPSFSWTTNGVTLDPALTDVADYQLSFEIYAGGDPYPTLSVISAPAGVTFIPGQITNSQLTYVTPTILFTPTADEVGVNYITVQATNSVGTYTYSIPVTVTPDTPQLSLSINGGITYGSGQYASGQSNYLVNVNPAYGGATQPQYGLSNTPFNFQLSSASNAGPTTYTLLSGPDGMTLDPNTGVGTWTPTKAQAGNTSVIIEGTNSAGSSTMELNFPTYFTSAPGTPSATYT